MSRYSKSYSNYVLRKKHQNVTDGQIFERDWLTFGNVHRLEPGKKPYFGDSNFIFTENNVELYEKKRNNGKWVAHFIYDDVKDSLSDVNEVKVNTNSNDLRSYAYYGSMVDLVRVSVEDIIMTFPARLYSLNETLHLIDADSEWVDTHKLILGNQFNINLHTDGVVLSEYDNDLRYVSVSWEKYRIVHYENSERVSTEVITSYDIIPPDTEVFESEKYHEQGYDYIVYQEHLMQWNYDTNRFEEIEYVTECDNYFEKCGDYLRYEGVYYKWDDTYNEYVKFQYYEICNDNYQKIARIRIGTEDNIYNIDAYRVDGLVVYASFYDNFAIEPKKEIIEEYFANLEGFEKKLLNRGSVPLYSSKLLTPFELPSGAYSFVDRRYTWPSDDYCIDIESPSYTLFFTSLIEMAEKYDLVYSDCIWRCMTHEAIKNFDWTYRREYNENDELDNVEGGQRMEEILHFYGYIYDIAKRYVDGIKMTNKITYDGYDNCTDAEISDKNDDKGWDIVSTIWEPYYYEEIPLEEIPSDKTVVAYPYMPVEVNGDSDEYISVGCEENAVYYVKKYNNPSTEMLVYEFFDKICSNNEPYVSKYTPWIRHSSESYNGLAYVELSGSPYCDIDEDCWDERNTFDDIPFKVTNLSPKFIRVIKNGITRYYALTNGGLNHTLYTHDKWYSTVNPNAITPLSCDIAFQRNLNISTTRIFKSKGTKHAIDMVMALFGYGRNDKSEFSGYDADYSITEFYYRTTPKVYNDVFYFYELLDGEPNHEFTEDETFETLPLDNSNNSPLYIRVGSNDIYQYFKLNGQNTLGDIIRQLYIHRTTDKMYDDLYSDVPLNDYYIGNNRFVVPYYTRDRVYSGNLYFQQKGGWGKRSSNNDFPYDYSETVPYLHVLPSVKDLLSVTPIDLKGDDVYYVSDLSDYVEFDEDAPYNLSHFFKVVDRYNPQRFASWKNIPMTGEIVFNHTYDVDGVTHMDYVHAKYLNDILPTIWYNNPHVGYGEYDLGEEYFEYMEQPFKNVFETYNFDDMKWNYVSQQIHYEMEKLSVTDAECGEFNKIDVTSTTLPLSTPIMTEMYDSEAESENGTYGLNSKVIILRNLKDGVYHKKFLKDVVLKYVLQVIPSTAILILEGFDNDTSGDLTYYNITVESNNDDWGTATGSGTFLSTTYALLTAEEKEGYHFVRWEKDGEIISENAVTQIMVCGDNTYTAIFEEDCVINTGCNTTCKMTFDCEPQKVCSTMFLCEIEDQCDVDFSCTITEECVTFDCTDADTCTTFECTETDNNENGND